MSAAQVDRSSLCTHCGYCLPVCPTYRVENDELHSPRGRVSIVLALHQGALTSDQAAEALSHCLLCRACHQACPADVRPVKLILAVREERPHSPSFVGRVLHFFTNSHRRSAWGRFILDFYRRSGGQRWLRQHNGLRWWPKLQHLEGLIPQARPLPVGRTVCLPAGRPRIGLLGGCMARLFYPQIGVATRQLFQEVWPFEVVVLDRFGCCGAPARESGHRQAFLRQARQTLDAFQRAGSLTAVVCDSGVCAVTAKSYARVLGNDPHYAPIAKKFSAMIYELTEFFAKMVQDQPVVFQDSGLGRLTFHDHCQTYHGLGIVEAINVVMTVLPNSYQELPRRGSCCGAGGVYLLYHPERSQRVLEDKLTAILESGADTVVGTNPGCLMHIESGLRMRGSHVQVRHLSEVLWSGKKKEGVWGIHPPGV
ncbi:MAG: (Fe-S)-binding protein [Magnetococcus sp. DMHC-6]